MFNRSVLYWVALGKMRKIAALSRGTKTTVRALILAALGGVMCVSAAQAATLTVNTTIDLSSYGLPAGAGPYDGFKWFPGSVTSDPSNSVISQGDSVDLTVNFESGQSLFFQNNGTGLQENFWLTGLDSANFTVSGVNLSLTNPTTSGTPDPVSLTTVSGASNDIGPLFNLGLNTLGDSLSFTGFHLTYLVSSLDVSSDSITGIWLNSGTVSSVATTPLPAALPLFLTGLSGFGFLTWRRKKRGLASAIA